jgi:hypothetical protein
MSGLVSLSSSAAFFKLIMVGFFQPFFELVKPLKTSNSRFRIRSTSWGEGAYKQYMDGV